MPEIKLTESEFMELKKYQDNYDARVERAQIVREHAAQQIAKEVSGLIEQGNDVRRILNIIWQAAHRLRQMEDPALRDIDIPPILDHTGAQLVTLDATNLTASWEAEVEEA